MCNSIYPKDNSVAGLGRQRVEISKRQSQLNVTEADKWSYMPRQIRVLLRIWEIREVGKYERVMITFLSSSDASYGLIPVISAALDIYIYVTPTRAEHSGTYHSPSQQAKPLKGSLEVNPIYIQVQPPCPSLRFSLGTGWGEWIRCLFHTPSAF